MPRVASPELPRLPAGLRDELLFSRIARFHVLTGGGHHKETTTRLFGSGFAITASGLPNRLSALCSYFEGRESVQSLVSESTFYPYFVPFLPERRAARLFLAMLESNAGGLKTALGLPASRIGASNALRLCRQCLIEDLGAGVAYWHRVHQAPGVLVCPDHKIPLDDCSLASAISRHALWLPRDVPQALIRQGPRLTSSQAAALLEIATASTALLDAASPPLSFSRLRDTYFERAAELGLTMGASRIRRNEFLNAFHAKWDCLSDVAGYRTIVNNDVEWPLALLRKQRGAKHPLKHLLVALTLFPSIADLLSRLRTTSAVNAVRHIAASAATARPHSPPLSTSPALADVALQMVTRDGLSLRAVADLLGLDTTTVRLYVQAKGGPILRRRKHITQAIEAKVAARLEVGDEIAAIAAKFELSYSSVWRVLAADVSSKGRRDELIRSRARARHRARWKRVLRTRGLDGVKSARSEDPAAYAWLYRNDRDWLVKVNSSSRRSAVPRGKPRADWPSRDVEASERIKTAAADLLEQPGPPTRLSAARIARHAGVSSYVDKHASKMPLAVARLKSIAENVGAFQMRRAAYWGKQMEAQGLPHSAWRVARLAGLK